MPGWYEIVIETRHSLFHTTDDDAFFQDVVGVTEADSYATEGTCSLLDPGWRAGIPLELVAPYSRLELLILFK